MYGDAQQQHILRTLPGLFSAAKLSVYSFARKCIRLLNPTEALEIALDDETAVQKDRLGIRLS